MSIPPPDPSTLDILTRYVLPPLLGLIGGVVGSVVAPWVNWGIEKKRERNKARREQIKGFRDGLSAMYKSVNLAERLHFEQNRNSERKSHFVISPRKDFAAPSRRLSTLLPYLGDDFFAAVPDDENIITPEEMRNLIERAFTIINALEKKWKLV